MTNPREVLSRLAELIRERNAIDVGIAQILGRPATPGNLGEFIAAQIFDIDLAPSGVNPGNDGTFRSGPLAGKTVNIKLYSEDGGLLDIGAHPADYYLVLTGARPKVFSGPRSLPRRIDSVYLFEMGPLRETLTERGVGIGVATSVRKAEWDAARIYPGPTVPALELSDEQIELLQFFKAPDETPTPT